MVIGRLDIAARFPPDELVFQARDCASQEWFVSTFGNGVNLDVDDHKVLDLELMRCGLRKRGIFGLVGGSVTGTVHPNRYPHHD